MTTLGQLLAQSANSAVGINVPDEWRQGRTAYGGFTAALALNAATNQLDEGIGALQAAQFAFVAPLAQDVTCVVSKLREGRFATQVSVDVLAGAALGMRAQLIFAGVRSSLIQHDLVSMPLVDAAETYQPMGELRPAFFANFDVRFVGEVGLCSGSANPELVAWVRLLEPEGLAPQVAMLAAGDCLPPAAMASLKTFAPISSMNWSVHIAGATKPGDWILMRSRSLFAANGGSFQTMEAWSPAGVPLMLSTQTVAIFD